MEIYMMAKDRTKDQAKRRRRRGVSWSSKARVREDESESEMAEPVSVGWESDRDVSWEASFKGLARYPALSTAFITSAGEAWPCTVKVLVSKEAVASVTPGSLQTAFST